MGGLNAVYHDFFESNFENPASLGFLQYTSFQIGMFAKKSTYKRFDDKQNVWTGNLEHLSLSFPIINPLNEALERRESDFSWGTGISLQPYSQVGYYVRIENAVDSIGDVLRTFKGVGGLYKINWSNGFKYKNFAAGINLGYTYGKQSFDEETFFLDLENAYTNVFTSTTAYKGLSYRFGLMYEHPLDLKEAREKDDSPSRLLSVGAYLGAQATLDTKSDIFNYAESSAYQDRDTAFIDLDQEGEAILPGGWGLGAMYRHAGDFRFGVDYSGAKWSDYSNTARPSIMKDTWRFGIGAAWIPDANSITSYFRRVEYRAGFSLGTDPRVIEGEQVKQSTFSVGANLPLILQRNIAWFQVGLDYGTRSGGPNLNENFVRAKVGFIFNDNTWFIRGKYN
ncbi:MAG: hypothetical protein M3R25_07785 [Bacteroidota bacterium]|nr:hypothetical protein [Bacteroidota bacterium]